jgi:16S rRNA (cytosine967-C5)-methyltransferase
VAELQEKQRAILASAARLVKPGGRLVYATCSLLEEENERIAGEFAAAHPDFALLDPVELGLAPELCAGGFLRLWPHRHATDGFFAAVWQRKA